METSAIQERPDRSRPTGAHLSFESVASRSDRYRPDVDGLRAVAVLAVVLYHLEISAFPNGYVGVDVFYVISGYLITSLISKDLAAGHFSVVSFYERRMRRIFPALFTVLFFCCLGATVLFIPPEMTQFGKSLFATTLFLSNFYFWRSAKPLGYFDAGVKSQPLLHTWSLAVEEQFYLVFPITLFLLFRWAKTRAKAWLIFLSAASFALNLWMTQHKPITAFYSSVPRAWELLIGALLAMNAIPILRSRILREFTAMLGLAMILGAITLPIRGVQFRGTFVLLPTAGTWLVIYAGQAGSSFVGRFLSLRPVTFVGIISYSLYLWHWPIIVFSKHLPFRLSNAPEIVTVLFSSVLLAFLSFEFIERPFRGSGSLFSRKQIFALGCAASVASAVLGFVLVRSQGLPERYDAGTRQLIDSNLKRADDFDPSCGNWGKDIRSASDIKFCNLGGQFPRKILFFGDSYVEQLLPAIRQLSNSGELQDHGVVTAFNPGCLPDEHLNYRVSPGYHCDSFAKYVLLRAQEKDIDVVFLGYSNWWTRRDDRFCVTDDGKCEPLSRDALRQRFLSDLSEEIRTLQIGGKRVIISLPFPEYKDRIPDLEISNAVFGRFGLAEAPREHDLLSLRLEIKQIALQTGAEIFDPRQSICPRDQCVTAIDGVSIYKDDGHLAGSGVEILASNLRNTVQRVLAERTPVTTQIEPLKPPSN
jgi:peptidoglycan/LPS O-acetylase OafA/YrhL